MTTIEKPTSVDSWIAQEYDNIKAYLISHEAFDTDTFHDAYLSLLDAITPDIDINHYRRLFDAIYAELRKKKVWDSFRSVNVPEIVFMLLKSDDETETDDGSLSEGKQDITAKQIKSYARRTLSGEEYKLFDLRFEQGMTYRQIGLYIGKGKDYAQSHTIKICDTIRKHFSKRATAI